MSDIKQAVEAEAATVGAKAVIFVRANALKAIGVSAVVGFVVGKFFL